MIISWDDNLLDDHVVVCASEPPMVGGSQPGKRFGRNFGKIFGKPIPSG
jgi:hypothetical protein